MTAGSFDDFLSSLRRIEERQAIGPEDPTLAVIRSGAAALAALPDVTEETLAGLIRANPAWTRVLGLAIGFSQEQLASTLRSRLGSPSSSALIRAGRAAEIVSVLNESQLVEGVGASRGQAFTYADVLIARYGSRGRAGRAIGRGRIPEVSVQ